MSSPPEVDPQSVPAGVIGTPQGDVVALAYPATQDYPRLVFSAPRFEQIAIAEIIQPSVTEAVQAVLPALVPPYVTDAANAAVNANAVRRVGDTMTGPLMLSPAIPTANTMAATKQYVDTMVATSVPEVPPVPNGQSWARQTGQWVALTGGGSVTNVATTGGITGGPITTSGTIQLANMAGNTLKGNNTGSTAAPTDLTVAQTMTMLGAAPLNSPAFSGTPQLPTGTAAVTQAGGTNNTTVATTAFVAASAAAQLVSPAFTGNPTAPTPAPGDNDTSIATTAFVATSFAPLASPVFTGTPSLPTGTTAITQTAGDNDTSIATTQFVTTAVANGVAGYLPLVGGTLSGPGNLTVRGGILGGAAGSVPAAGSLTLNQNSVAGPGLGAKAGSALWLMGVNGQNTTLVIDGFGGVPDVAMRATGGTAASPTALPTSGYMGGLEFFGYTGAAYSINAPASIYVQSAEAGAMSTSAQGSRMTLNTTVIGASSPVASLQLQGNTATFSGNAVFPTSPLSGVYWGSTAGTAPFVLADTTNMYLQLGSNSGGFYNFRNSNGVNQMTLDTSGNLVITGASATKASGTTWANPSARDLKQNIQPYESGLQAVLALQPRTWDFASDSGIDAPGPHIGLVHDETSHMPEMHRTMKIGSGEAVREVDGLDCSAITFALVNAIKELNAKVDALSAGSPAP